MARQTISNVWLFFQADARSHKYKCRVCHKLVVGSAARTINLKRHVHRWHPEKIAQENIISYQLATGLNTSCIGENPSTSAILESQPDNGVNASTTTSGLTDDATNVHNNIGRKLFNVMVAYALPLTILDESNVKDLFATLRADYDAPSCNDLLNSILPTEYDEVLSQVMFSLSAAKSVCLATSDWFINNNLKYMSVAAYFISDANAKLNAVFLEHHVFHTTVASQDVAFWLSLVMKKFNILHKVTYMVTDTSETMTTAVSTLQKQNFPCFITTLNRMICLAIQGTIMKTLHEVRQVIVYLQTLPATSSRVVNCESFFFVMDMPHNWGSTLRMLEVFGERKDQIIHAISQLGVAKKSYPLDWVVIYQSTEVLKFFCSMLQEAMLESPLPISKAKLYLSLIVNKMVFFNSHSNLSVPVRLLVKCLYDRTLKDFNYLSHEAVTLTTLLDPRFRRDSIAECKLCYDTVVLHMEKINKNGNGNDYLNGETNTVVQEYGNNHSSKFNEQRLHNNKGSKNNIELDAYLAERILDRQGSTSAWWEQKKVIYPTLYKLMLEMSCIPASSMFPSSLAIDIYTIKGGKTAPLTSTDIKRILFVKYNAKQVSNQKED